MSMFKDELDRIADTSAAQYARVEAPADYADGFARAVRGKVRRRQIGTAALSVVAASVIGLAGLNLWGRIDASPAQPVPTEQPGEVVWSLDMGAESWSSPAVAGSVVIAAANDGVVRAVRIADGGVAWEFATDGPVRGGITVAEDMAYVLSDDGFVYALTVRGTLAWKSDVRNVPPARDVNDGYSSTPVVAGGLVYVGSADQSVYALDLVTGEIVWTYATHGAVSTMPAVADGVVYVTSHDSNLYALDSETGAKLWSQSLGAAIVSSPAVADGVVVSGSRASSVWGFDAKSGLALWSVSLGTSWADSSVWTGNGTAYFGSSSAGRVYAVDLQTGAEKWGTNVGGWPWARPSGADSVIYATSGRSPEHLPYLDAVYAIDRNTGVVLWRAATGVALEWDQGGAGYGAMTAPAVADHVVIVAALDGTLYAFAR